MSVAKPSLLRSEEMVYLQAVVPNEAARAFLHNLARLGCVGLTDLNAEQSAFQRRYMKEILRIAELERKISFFDTHLASHDVKAAPTHDIPDRRDLPADSLDRVEHKINKFYNELSDVIRILSDLDNSVNQAQDFEMVLNECGKLLNHRVMARNELEDRNQAERDYAHDHDNSHGIPMLEMDADMSNRNRDNNVGFSFVAGVVPRTLRPVLERQAFLVSRGNVFCLFSDVEKNDASPFIMFFLGGQLRRKLTRLCESLGVRLYLYPESDQDINAQFQQNSQQLQALENVRQQTKRQLDGLLQEVAQRYSSWKLFLIQEKTLMSAMNKLQQKGPLSLAEFWCPVADRPRVQFALDIATQGFNGVNSLSQIPAKDAPPTFFRTNDFTGIFQTIVNTYGVPRYREVNPALFTIVTFPFLFGMMFGDIGHGGALFLFGLYLCLNGENIKIKARESEMWGTFYNGRYLLTLMGAFAFYCGWIYNDCLSLGIDLGSNYKWDAANKRASNPSGAVYTFGMDPVWHNTDTELAFYNSLKMKLSVIIGVTQMTFGIFLSLLNHIHFGNYLSIIGEFIPQILFMMSLFGYMVVMIIIKWSTDWVGGAVSTIGANGQACISLAPNLITTLINMVLKIGNVECTSQLYEGQGKIQLILVAIAGISVPWMLLLKPIVIYCRMKTDSEHVDLDHAPEEDAPAGGHEHHDFGEVCIHQMIHTIEFVLGTVSNTASYLRLWALSLAHAELAKVFFEQVLLKTWNMGNPVFIVIGAGMWLGATGAVLMAMDVLECFLHALRLHWVEFQNKFFAADGYEFRPLSYEADILAEKTA